MINADILSNTSFMINNMLTHVTTEQHKVSFDIVPYNKPSGAYTPSWTGLAFWEGNYQAHWLNKWHPVAFGIWDPRLSNTALSIYPFTDMTL